MLLFLTLTLACTKPLPDSTAPEETATPDSAQDSAQDSTPPEDSTECREDGESCTPDPNHYRGDCCLSRQTCYPEGCYYSDPTP